MYLGSNQVSVSWLPEKQQWDRFHTMNSYRFDKEGKCVSWNDKTLFLTTIPPVEYVEESRWVWVREGGMTTMAYESKDVAEYEKPKFDLWQLCEVKIKVKK